MKNLTMTYDLKNLENIKKISKLHWDKALCPVAPGEINFWHWCSKNMQKQIKFFGFCQLYLISFFCLFVCLIFCKGLSVKTNANP